MKKKQQQKPCNIPNPLRLASGEVAVWQRGMCASPDQGEWFSIRDVNKRLSGWNIGIWHVEGGEYISECFVFSKRYKTREEALRAAIARKIRMARKKYLFETHFFYKISKGEYEAVISWAFGLIGRQVTVFRTRPLSCEIKCSKMIPGQMALPLQVEV